MQAEIDNNAITIGDFSIPLSTMDRSSRQKISKETLDVNYTLEQMDLTDVYRTFCPTAAKIKKPFFSSGPGTFSRIDYVLGHKISLNRKKTGKFTNIWKY